MKNTYFKTLRNIVLAVISPILAQGKSSAEKIPVENDSDLNLSFELNKNTTNKSPLLVLKPSKDDNGWNFYGHRSHRSHVSHRSHQSHRSHYSSTYSTPSSSSSSSSSTGNYSVTRTPTPYNYKPATTSTSTLNSNQSESITSTSSSDNGITLTHPRFRLGDRVIKPDFEGYDVTELILILQKKNYLIIDANVSLNEESKYEGVLILAVKEFQKDHGLYGDGIVGPATVKELMK